MDIDDPKEKVSENEDDKTKQVPQRAGGPRRLYVPQEVSLNCCKCHCDLNISGQDHPRRLGSAATVQAKLCSLCRGTKRRGVRRSRLFGNQVQVRVQAPDAWQQQLKCVAG